MLGDGARARIRTGDPRFTKESPPQPEPAHEAHGTQETAPAHGLRRPLGHPLRSGFLPEMLDISEVTDGLLTSNAVVEALRAHMPVEVRGFRRAVCAQIVRGARSLEQEEDELVLARGAREETHDLVVQPDAFCLVGDGLIAIEVDDTHASDEVKLTRYANLYDILLGAGSDLELWIISLPSLTVAQVDLSWWFIRQFYVAPRPRRHSRGSLSTPRGSTSPARRALLGART